MPVYKDTEQLYEALRALFDQVAQDPKVVGTVSKSRLVIRLKMSSPAAEVTINGRHKPPQVIYGETKLRPELDVNLTADALHHILLKDLSLRKALGSGQMKVRGPVWKSFVLEDILHRGQELYPQLAREQGLDGRGAAT